MSKCAIKVFPRKNGSLRSRTFTVKCGEYAKLTGYDLCPGVCIRINEVHENPCQCEYNEQPYCLNGGQLGLSSQCKQAVIPMPGCYVAYICEDEPGLAEDITVYLEHCTNIENVQTVVASAAVGA